MPGGSDCTVSGSDVASCASDSSGSRCHQANRGESGRKSFIVGVVEGFYGRPWTTEQRKDLFSKMQKWGMDSYLYAPKDDCKHRAYWREQYTVEEAEHLQSLILLAQECSIDFYYAISPGLDIVYSSSKELAILKRKLDQVAQLGCKAFALLFDDIEPEMCKQDKEVFQSFAQAQVSVTNEIFEHLGQPNFLFCPTQYCTVRAVPSVRSSEYLQTIGTKLAPDIQVMWTGDKVIPKTITRASLEDISEVLKRPCVIWDNLHANDYDQKRVFLGPYSGRSPDIIPKLGGVLVNPNCEYGANFVAIHTLAQWSRCKADGTLTNVNDSITADIKLEIQSGEEGSSTSEGMTPSPFPPHIYHPKNALIKALLDWVPEFSRQKTVWGPMSKPQVGLAQPAVIQTSSTAATATVSAPLAQMALTGAITTPLPSIGANAGDMSILSTGNTPATAAAAAVAAATVATSSMGQSLVSSNPQSLSHIASSCDNVALTFPSLSSVGSALQPPIALSVMNSLVSTNKVVVDVTPLDSVVVTSSDQTMSPAAVAATVLGVGGGPAAAAAAAASVLTSSNDPMVMVTAAAVAAANVAGSSVAACGVPATACSLTQSAITLPAPVGVPAGLQRVIPVQGLEPMDCLPTPSVSASDDLEAKNHDFPMESMTNPPTPASVMQVEAESGGGLHKTESTMMLCEPTEAEAIMGPPATTQVMKGSYESDCIHMYCDDQSDATASPVVNDKAAVVSVDSQNRLSVEDLYLLVNLFYLPSEHGPIGVDLLNDFYWLKRNATAMLSLGSLGSGSKEDRSEWERRAVRFQNKVADIERLFLKLCAIDNRELVYDLYTYVWDMCCVIQTLEGFVQWLFKGCVSPKCQQFVMGQQTWFSGIREAYLSGEHEPWVFRGGLILDMLRLLPLDSGSDLYIYKHPDVPANSFIIVRPYLPKDEQAIYRLVATAYEQEIDAPMGLCSSDRELLGDHEVGALLTLSPEYCFVCENSADGSIIGYAVATNDVVKFHRRYSIAWLPEMRLKYPRKVEDATLSEDVMLTPMEEIAQSFHGEPWSLPPFLSQHEDLIHTYTESGQTGGQVNDLPFGFAKIRLAQSYMQDYSVSKRFTMLLFSCMRASGTLRLYVELNRSDTKTRDFYAVLGFLPTAISLPAAPGAPAMPLPTTHSAPSATSATSSTGVPSASCGNPNLTSSLSATTTSNGEAVPEAAVTLREDSDMLYMSRSF